MKIESTDVSETRKHLSFEIEPDVIDAEITRVAARYARTAKVPGFRPGKVPAHVVRQRYKDQILHDVAHDMIPRIVGDALRERSLEPVASPDIKDVVVEEGRPMTFVADFETLPPIDPGEYSGVTLRKPPAVLEVGAVDHALDHLQERNARWQPVEDRAAAMGDTLLVDLTRTRQARLITLPGEAAAPADGQGEPEAMQNISIELGATANPPGLDEGLVGASPGETREVTVTHGADDPTPELAGATVHYSVKLTAIRRKDLPALDDEFAKEVSDVDTLEALRDRIREDLQKGAEQDADHHMRLELLGELARRLTVVPDVLVEQEIDRRLEEFLRRIMEQGVDPMKAGVDWREFRERQREAAVQTVKSTLVVDEIARREQIEASEADLEAEIERYAERAGRTPAAIRARLEKDDAIGRIRAGIRREKVMEWLIDHANVVTG
jgi:trigger factor